MKSKDIICISSIDWDFIWQGHQEIMSYFACHGSRVLFIENTGVRSPRIRDIPRLKKRVENWLSGIEGIREVRDNLFVFSPVMLPFPYSRIALWVNRFLVLSVLNRWMKVMRFTDPAIWVFLPTPISLAIIENQNNKAVIYYCIDNFTASSSAAKKIARPENILLEKADLVFVTSRELLIRCRQYNQRVHYFPFAVNFEAFAAVRSSSGHCAAELENMPRPLIGYVGGVHKWIDFFLLEKLAQRYPDYSFIFVGPLQADIGRLLSYKNMHFLGQKPHDKIPYYMKEFDVCIIPYLITEYTRNVYPTKLNEYLAMGKPVVSTALPEVGSFNTQNGDVVLSARSHEEFASLLQRALVERGDKLYEKRIAAAKKNSWSARIAEMNTLVEQAIAEDRVPFDWQARFRELCQSARSKILKASFALLGIYFLLFHTPLVWWLASPLKIAQPPERSDCIVVFAGGVGESGRAMQGYEERVQYAVELYKRGYARNLVFSSGYRYIFEETKLMKALAVSLGVPESAITLEDNATNTYQSVSAVSAILAARKWQKALFISSPYHMLRLSLAGRKLIPGAKVLYTPIPRSTFYYRDEKCRHNIFCRKVSLRQARAILHEYLGILDYYLKGYV